MNSNNRISATLYSLGT